MKIIKGTTRWVILTKNYAFKIPSLYSYQNFLYGLLANMQERNFSKVIKMKSKLCPIYFYIPFGLLVVMPKVEVLNNDCISKKELKKFCKCDCGIIPSEIKYDSFGFLNGNLVAIDYGI